MENIMLGLATVFYFVFGALILSFILAFFTALGQAIINGVVGDEFRDDGIIIPCMVGIASFCSLLLLLYVIGVLVAALL